MYWLPFLVAGLVIALFLAATVFPPPRSKKEAVQAAKTEVGLERTLGFFFWFLLVILILLVILGYVIAG